MSKRGITSHWTDVVADVERIPILVVERDRARGEKLTNRFGNTWATVQAGKTLVIGLHPWSGKYPRPGTKGSVQIGLVVSQDEPIEEFAARLRKHGVEVSDVIESEEANDISFADPDGNPIYVGDRDSDVDMDHEPNDAVGSTTP